MRSVTVFRITEDTSQYLGQRVVSGERETSWYAIPYDVDTFATPTSLPSLLRATGAQVWASLDNTGGRLFGDTLDDFASWAAERLGAPVAVYEVDGELTGMWPGNPNLMATWYTSSIALQTVAQGYGYTGGEDVARQRAQRAAPLRRPFERAA